DPRLNTTTYEGVPIIAPSGEFDFSTIGPLRTALDHSLAHDNRVILDLAGLTFADSSVLGLLAGSAKRAKDAGGWLRLAAPQRAVRRVLRVTSLDSVIPIFDSIELAATI